MRLHQRRPGLFLDRRHVLRRLVPGNLKQQLPCQRIPVRMQPSRRNPDQHIPRLDSRARHHLVAVDRAHNKSRQIVLAFAIEPRHLRCLAANQRATVRSAGIG